MVAFHGQRQYEVLLCPPVVPQCVPDTRSRAALGELSDRGLYDIFVSEFGAPGTPRFEAARTNFIVSEAGYAVASYLLQVRRLMTLLLLHACRVAVRIQAYIIMRCMGTLLLRCCYIGRSH